MNKLVFGETARFSAVDEHIEKVRFLHRLKTISRFADIFMDGTADEIREKRDELENGKHLLEDPDAIALCEKLIKGFTARLYTIPHERHLRDNLS